MAIYGSARALDAVGFEEVAQTVVACRFTPRDAGTLFSRPKSLSARLWSLFDGIPLLQSI